ncbi:PAS domain-containing protein [Pseudogemmobacter faecipullorum]|uniref:PAS domain-containing protein n=1 Tax=Pseudogemmobacter faecipullorum TaxID=2755041 RepID=A0ABS8CL03_9RHOB|nr:PAS domain-containing protein [Pseudogemmobacter faecipullorum]MCB5410077.1 PAS domain-containing protein [Pseudogemmobacter faecipullorum]
MLDQEIDGTGPMRPVRFGALAQLREHWQRLCARHGGPPPSSALDPADLGPLIEDLFIAERIGRGLLRLRVAGRNLSALAGVDMQGLPLSALLTPETRISFADLVERMFRDGQPVETGLRASSGYGRQIASARLLLLPLALPRLGPEVLLGCLATERPQSHMPGLRYAISGPDMLLPLTSGLAPALPRGARGPRLLLDQPWVRRAPARRAPGHLRLVASRESA